MRQQKLRPDEARNERVALAGRESVPHPLKVEEARASLFSRDWATVVASKNTVSVSRNDPISKITKPPGDDWQQKSQHPPESKSRHACFCYEWCRSACCCLCSQVPENKNSSIGTGKHQLTRMIAVQHNINRIKIPCIHPMPRQNPLRQLTLQRSEPKHSSRVPPQNELHQPVAKPTHPVVKKNWMHAR